MTSSARKKPSKRDLKLYKEFDKSYDRMRAQEMADVKELLDYLLNAHDDDIESAVRAAIPTANPSQITIAVTGIHSARRSIRRARLVFLMPASVWLVCGSAQIVLQLLGRSSFSWTGCIAAAVMLIAAASHMYFYCVEIRRRKAKILNILRFCK